MPLTVESLIAVDWPAPVQVRAYSTTRLGGVSQFPFESLNLGLHVGDISARVDHNREQLAQILNLPNSPLWLEQVHGVRVLRASDATNRKADASVAQAAGQVCAIMTADCLPVLLCDRQGTTVAAAHGGWRGLLRGVLEQTVRAMNLPPESLLVWLGPAIGDQAFEVGNEVRDQFLALDSGFAACFRPSPAGRWLADIQGIARWQLHQLGITAIYGGEWCTFTDSHRFFSYRRDGQTGRMASLIWLASP